MNTYIISDIHGCNDTFRKALKSIALKKTDKLILLGDLIDRGPDSKAVLDTVLLLIEHGFDIECVMGNHEKMFLNAFKDITERVNWIKNGGKETLKSFLVSKIERIPNKYIKFIKTFKTHLELGKYIFVHAGINMTLKEPFEDVHSLLWLRNWKEFYDEKWLNGRVVIHGHTPKSKEELEKQFFEKNKVLCIDNGSFLNNRNGFGAICVLNLEKMLVHFESP
jgi:serine/threonine protein phosphatase 1